MTRHLPRVHQHREAPSNLLRQTTKLAMTIPEVRARALDDFSRTIAMMAEAAAKRTGLSPDDLRDRRPSRARIFGVILAVTTPWEDFSGEHINADMFARMDAGLAHLEHGLHLQQREC